MKRNSNSHFAAKIIAECGEYGVSLQLDGDTLVVKTNGRAWKNLIIKIEANVDEIATVLAIPSKEDDAAF